MKVLNYTVKVHPAEEGGFWAEVPALPGCFTQGETIEEIAAMAKESIECHISGLKKVGMPVPIEKAPKKIRGFSIPIAVRVSH
ncbi:MAG: type II toxin-antitoxin system HicB family antitoxin [bacterium]|nr:type II toxin-antitoxin system HicB family antitoxin [bacterium]